MIRRSTGHVASIDAESAVLCVLFPALQRRFNLLFREAETKVSKVDKNASKADARVKEADAKVDSVKAQRPLTHCNACGTNKHA